MRKPGGFFAQLLDLLLPDESSQPARRTDADIGREISSNLDGMNTFEQRAAYLLTVAKEPSNMQRANLHQEVIKRIRFYINKITSADKIRFNRELMEIEESVARARLATELELAGTKNLLQVRKMTGLRKQEQDDRDALVAKQQVAFADIQLDRALSKEVKSHYAAVASEAEGFVFAQHDESPAESVPGLAQLIAAEWSGRRAILDEAAETANWSARDGWDDSELSTLNLKK